jgi:hypothetical protein
MGATTFFGAPAAPSAIRINAAAAGDNTLVAAAVGQSTRVYGLRVSAAAAVVVQIKRGATVLETLNLPAGAPRVLELRELPYFVTGVNEALVMNLSSAVQVDGVLESATVRV